MNDLPTYVLERTFDAPRTLVWRTWTDSALLSRWYGPNVETLIHALDVRPGGLWLNEMKMSGRSSYQRTEYLEIDEPERLVCLMSNADRDWKVASNPMMPDWPRTLLTTVTLHEADGRTMMHLTWKPHNANEAEVACFAAAIAGMDKGWASGMELLAELLAELQA